MIEPIFKTDIAGGFNELAVSQTSPEEVRDSALLGWATYMALEGAMTHGIDLPVGAVVANDSFVLGAHYASDRRFDNPELHAEKMSLISWLDSYIMYRTPAPTTLVVSAEPCPKCQDLIASFGNISEVAFGLPRRALEERGLVRPHTEDIFERTARLGLPFNVRQIKNERLRGIGETILDHSTRDISTQQVKVDRHALSRTFNRQLVVA